MVSMICSWFLFDFGGFLRFLEVSFLLISTGSVRF